MKFNTNYFKKLNKKQSSISFNLPKLSLGNTNRLIKKFGMDNSKNMAWSGKTTVPIVDYPESYGYKKIIKQISPNDFMEITRQESLKNIQKSGGKRDKNVEYMYHPEKYEEVIIDKENVKRLKPALLSKRKIMAEPWIETRKGEVVGHEGRHRAIAARELGMKIIPVHFVETRLDEQSENKKLSEGQIEERFNQQVLNENYPQQNFVLCTSCKKHIYNEFKIRNNQPICDNCFKIFNNTRKTMGG